MRSTSSSCALIQNALMRLVRGSVRAPPVAGAELWHGFASLGLRGSAAAPLRRLRQHRAPLQQSRTVRGRLRHATRPTPAQLGFSVLLARLASADANTLAALYTATRGPQLRGQTHVESPPARDSRRINRNWLGQQDLARRRNAHSKRAPHAYNHRQSTPAPSTRAVSALCCAGLSMVSLRGAATSRHGSAAQAFASGQTSRSPENP